MLTVGHAARLLCFSFILEKNNGRREIIESV